MSSRIRRDEQKRNRRTWAQQVTAPRLRTLRMSNVPEDCDLRLDLPSLEDVTIMYYNGSDAPINRMLKAATRLRSFDSYKLQGTT